MDPLTIEFLISDRRKSPNSNSNDVDIYAFFTCFWRTPARNSAKKGLRRKKCFLTFPRPQGGTKARAPMFQLPWVPHVPIALGPPCSNCPGSPMFQLPLRVPCTVSSEIKLFDSLIHFSALAKSISLVQKCMFVQKVFSQFRFGRTRKQHFRSKSIFRSKVLFPFK